jgi:multiple sugar transport system permease protein
MSPRRAFDEARLMLVGLLILIWTLIPIYHLFVMSITPQAEAFAGAVWPKNPTLDNYTTVLTMAPARSRFSG